MRAELVLKRCLFDDNFAESVCGAIYASNNVTIKINDSHFTRNRVSGEAGAILISIYSYLCVTNCTFTSKKSSVGEVLLLAFPLVL